MREEIPDGDVIAIRTAPGRHVLAHRIVQGDLPTFDELHHHRGGREYLGQRREVEDGVVGGRRRPRLVRERTEGLSVEHTVRPPHLDDGGRADARTNRVVEHLPDRRWRHSPEKALRPMEER